MYVILDSTDNSVTLSKKLAKALDIGEDRGACFIFMFSVKGENTFGFKRVPSSFAKKTECGLVSYNTDLKSFGFITNCPTVNYMVYRGLKDNVKLKVTKEILSDGSHFFKIKN